MKKKINYIISKRGNIFEPEFSGTMEELNEINGTEYKNIDEAIENDIFGDEKEILEVEKEVYDNIIFGIICNL